MIVFYTQIPYLQNLTVCIQTLVISQMRPKEKNIEQLEKYRIAIYYKNFKGIFNVTDWKFEEIISYDPNIEITEDVVKDMKKEVVKFLKTATVAKVPKIKI
ncbi:hypothetical protein [Pyrococcus abyssi]|uniref:Uncharacterized protein n=1 Tax=Pyrococcus abyssi (strain GE5 / Orsay) TaxID=272844 RepID=Q9UZG2_PYRAB|nr:hypothetical protein [Pyrococcus abyssi]CAB50097.1 Hypothetical protein PAB1592 [Pyrococcus abyssi GE5]CCE70617.1 TPA: hypothetical protein PAB1592 [Pyrococcus abyssi GE5]